MGPSHTAQTRPLGLHPPGALGWLLALALVAFAAGCSDSNPPPFPMGPDADPSTFPCEPACIDGFTCDDGVCIPACEPECPFGTVCQADGSCAADPDAGLGPDFERNACGGFGELAGVPGTTCGPCGTGHWLCENEDLVSCADATGLNACGTCGELPGVPGGQCGEGERWACTPDGALECVGWFDANPCLGTADLGDAAPGRPCGECGAGHYECVGLNETVCVEGDEDAACECDPSTSPPVACGTVAGRCERGVRFCEADGRYGACVVAPVIGECGPDDACDPGSVCVEERIHPYETIEDGCIAGDEAACTRRVCRATPEGTSCASNADCRNTAACANGICSVLVSRPTAERCNGVDDDCDGFIDNDDVRNDICGACPYNMMLVVNAEREFGRRRICIDIYEASRPDATDVSAGGDETRTTSRPGVLPWTGLTAEEAVRACAAEGFNAQIPGGVAERRLCVVDEWPLACNLEGYEYPYGDGYTAGACNDSAGVGHALPTGSLDTCGYIVPGGRFPNFDFSGNVEEWVRGEGAVMLAGGSYRDAGDDLSCGAVREPTSDSADHIGFRCCANSILVTEFGE